MANFLDDLSVYNAKAALVISQVAADGNTDKANMMSSLKSTANDTTLSEAIRLNALTALINLGSLLDIPLPPYFPLTTTYANTETYVGIHDDLTGLQGGAPGEYYHVTLAERNSIANAATVGDISWANLTGSYTDNATFAAQFNAKQNALTGPGYVKMVGGVVTYDTSTFLTTISGIASGSAAGGELSGTYPSPTLSNAAVISKVLTGFTGTSLPTPITAADSILSAIQKLNNNIASLIVSPSGVASVALTTNSSGVFTTTTTPQTGAATLDVSLNTQTASKFLASPTSASGTPTFRAFSSIDLPDSGATAGAYGSSSLIPQITVDAKGRITAITTVAAAAGGQVNSVTLTIPSIFGTVTNTGTASAVNLTYGLVNQTANYVWAGPISGAAAVPQFRALVEDDIPDLSTTKITNLDSELSTFLTRNLANSTIFIGNTSDAPVGGEVTGDLTVAYVNNNGNDEADFTIANGVVTYPKIQDVTAETLLGRYFATNGEVQELTLDPTAFTINNSTGVIGLQTPNPSLLTNKGDLLTRDASAPVRLGVGANATIFMADTAATTGNKWVAMSGDATIATSGAVTIANGAVTLAKMANMATASFIGRTTAGTGVPEILTATQATAMLNQFSSSAKGLVPAASGVNDTTKYLRGDGSWQAITGTGTVTSVSVATANGFAGTVATASTTPAISMSLDSLTGVLKGTGAAIAVATAGTDVVTPGQITQTTGAGSGLTMASGNLLGRVTSSAGVIEAIAVNSSLSLSLPSGVPTLSLNLGNQNIFTVQQQMPSLRLNGSTSGFVSFTPPATAGAQGYTLPSAFPGAGTTGYLTSNDAGVLVWASAAGTTTASVTFDAVAGNTAPKVFNGSQAMTIGYATIGAQQLNANLTGLSGLTYASGTPFVKMTGAGTFSLDTNTYISGTTTQYAVLVGGAGNSIASITPVASNKLLISNGTSANPGWTDASYLATTTQYGILYSSATNVVAEITPPVSSGLYLQWTGSGYTWASGGGGGGGGSVTSFSFVNANGFVGTVSTPTSTPALTLTTSISGILKGSAGALVAAIPGTDYAPATSGTSILKGNGSGGFANATAGTDYLTSIGLTMPSAFTVTPLTLTANGTFTVTGAGTASQYVRGDGTLALLPTAGGGGTAVSYYLNGSVPSSVVGYEQMNRVPVIGAGTNYTLNNTSALMAQFITDVNDPSLLNIPAGAWDINAYFSASNNTGSPTFYVELLKYDTATTTFTSIATGSTEIIDLGTTIHLYSTSISVPSTALTVTDRLVIRVYVNTAGSRTITFHTEGPRLAQVITTFSSGLTSLNGLNAQAQFFATPGTAGTAPAWTSTTATHTLNIPFASASSVTAGLISKTEYDTFNGKLANVLTTTGDIIYSSSGTTAARLGIGTANQVLAVSAGLVPEWKTISGTGDVVGPAGAVTNGNFAVFDTSGQIIKESAVASLTAAGAAVFNSSVTVGVSGAAPTGQLVFRNSANAFTTTIQASTSASANASYTWPQAPGTVGQILSTDGSGNLSWTAAGAGDMTLAGAQTVAGTKTFNAGAIRINNATNNGYHILASLAGVSGALTATFPAASGTVPLLSLAQTFTAAQTFQAQVNIGNATYSSAILQMGGTTANRLAFPSSPVGGPVQGAAPSAGSRIVIANLGSSGNSDYAIGYNTSEMWMGANQGGVIGVYSYLTRIARFGPVGPVNANGLHLGETTTNGALQFWGTTSNLILFNDGGVAAPSTTTTRSAGSKIVIKTNLGSGSTDYAIGYNTNEMWFAGGNTFGWYVNSTTASLSLSSAALTFASGVNIVLSTTTGTKIGTATNQLLGFFNATPVAQQTGGNLTAAATYAANEQTMLNRVYTAMRNLGLIAQ